MIFSVTFVEELRPRLRPISIARCFQLHLTIHLKLYTRRETVNYFRSQNVRTRLKGSPILSVASLFDAGALLQPGDVVGRILFIVRTRVALPHR